MGTTVAFNGALSPDEMYAYVALRMVGQNSPGSTSLTRHLITEFAGSDPILAEILMTLTPGELIRLPASLAQVLPYLPIDSSALLDWQLSRTQGASGVAAAKRLDRLYWRACVRSLLPWLEERRFILVDKLRPTLEQYLHSTKGVWKKEIPWQKTTIDIPIDDLEFNDVVAMSHRRSNPLTPTDQRAKHIISACRHAKRVRDALAHMRPPTANEIEDAVRTVEEVLR
jgi:hypothetical protein